MRERSDELKTVGRLATYLQGYGDLMVATNRWDPAVLQRFRADPLVSSFPGALDDKATTEQLEHVATLIPDEWLAPAATGSPAQCVATIREQFALGTDGVILHGVGPDDLVTIVDEYARTRPCVSPRNRELAPRCRVGTSATPRP